MNLPPDWVCTKINYRIRIAQYMRVVNGETQYIVFPIFFLGAEHKGLLSLFTLVNGLVPILHLENYTPRPGSYTGAVDSMPLRTHGGSAAQRRPGNTRSKQERRK